MKCAQCGAEFEEKKHGRRRKYCSRQCKWQDYYMCNHEELRAKQKIYYITGKWPKGKLT